MESTWKVSLKVKVKGVAKYVQAMESESG